LFIDSLLTNDERDPALRMAQALADAITRALDLVKGAGSGSDSVRGPNSPVAFSWAPE